MKQVKYCMSEGKTNKWLRDNSDKEIIDIQMSAGGFAIIYEDSSLWINVGISMKSIEKMGLSVGIIGGIGLGLMLGSEFSGRYITILGAVLVIISLVAMGVLSYKGKK